MNMTSKITMAAMVFIIVCATAYADSEGESSPSSQARRNAEADGAALAIAVYCSTPKPQLSAYAEALKAVSQKYAAEHRIEFSPAEYEKLVMSGFARTLEFISSVKPTEKNKKENCDIVREKIKQKLSVAGQTKINP